MNEKCIVVIVEEREKTFNSWRRMCCVEIYNLFITLRWCEMVRNLRKFARLVFRQRLPSMIKRLDLTLSFDRSNRTFEHELEYLEDMEHELDYPDTKRPKLDLSLEPRDANRTGFWD